MENNPIKKGWVVITPTLLQGDVMAWSAEEEGVVMPDVYATEVDAWKEIADTMITGLQQFIDGERKLEDTDFSTDEYVAQYEEYEDGSFAVFYEGDVIIESTLEKWRIER